MQNSSISNRLEQRSVRKFLAAEMCKPYEIYRRICDMYREVCFNPDNVYKCVKHGFVTMMSPSQKDNPWSGNLDSLVKKSYWCSCQ